MTVYLADKLAQTRTAPRSASSLPEQRSATVADIVARLKASTYQWTAVTALGWGMGPAQVDIEKAVAAAEAQGLVVVGRLRGKQMVQLAAQRAAQPQSRVLRTVTVVDRTITLLALTHNSSGFAFGIDVHRPANDDDHDVYDIPVGTPMLAEQAGCYDRAEADEVFAEFVAQYTAADAEPAAA